jgi:hypothetical protein
MRAASAPGAPVSLPGTFISSYPAAVGADSIEWIFRSDVVVVAAAATSAGVPEITRSLGIRGRRVRSLFSIYVPVPEGLTFLNLVAENRRIAVTVARPRDYRSLQLKGKDAAIAGTTPEDEAWVTRYRSELGPALEATGVPPTLWERVFSREYVTVRFTPEDARDQTPGRSAGRPIETEG